MVRCIFAGCRKQSSFNFEGNTKGLYCAQHKTDDMVDVRNKTCCEKGCKKHPIFNMEGETKGLYCAQHKTDDMVDVINKRCVEPDCKKIPYFNFEGEKYPLYCAEHKKEGMMDVKNKTCCEEGCKTHPYFNFEGEKRALYCVQHKKPEMINVLCTRCVEPDCKIRPYFNFEGEKRALYCTKHKKREMIDVIHKRCVEPDCKKQPLFNMKGEPKGLYCAQHKKPKMIDVKNRTCKSSWCFTHVQNKYDGFCLRCFIYLFPDRPVSRNYKTKEYAVVEFVTSKFPEVHWVADKIINAGCSKRRPDLLLDLGYQILIVEIDENQHIDYDCSCENKRIMELSQDTGHRPIIFIRFNPDKYIHDGKTITSCWGTNKKGICVVKKSKQREWKERLNILEQQVTYWIDPQNKTNKTVETIQLFYDE